MQALQSPNLSARYQAWTALVGMQVNARPALYVLASNPNPRFRARALWALAAIGDGAAQAIETALRDKSADVRLLSLIHI